MKVAILSDTHCGIRNASQIFMDYQARFYSEIFFPYLKEHGITEIWHLGDAFENRRYIDLKALNSYRKSFLEPLVDNGMHTTIINGNHDLFFKDSSRISSLRELLGHFIEHVTIIHQPTEIIHQGTWTKILWLPWINQENESKTIRMLKQSKADLILGHFEFSGFNLYKGVVASSGQDTKLFERFKLVLSGHYHTKSHKGSIHYLGAPMEFTWNDCDDPKYFHIFDLETHTLTPVRNPITIFKKIRYSENDPNIELLETSGDYRKEQCYNKFVRIYIESKKNTKRFDDFIGMIESTGPLNLEIVNIDRHLEDEHHINLEEQTSIIDTEQESNDILQLLDQYISKHSADFENLETSHLRDLLFSIHQEATMLERD